MQLGVAELFPSGLRLITEGIPTGRSRGGEAPGRAGVVLLHRAPQAQGPTRAEPHPPGRR
jgi:hypothetical protein